LCGTTGKKNGAIFAIALLCDICAVDRDII
jgi:hypothetical protein